MPERNNWAVSHRHYTSMLQSRAEDRSDFGKASEINVYSQLILLTLTWVNSNERHINAIIDRPTANYVFISYTE